MMCCECDLSLTAFNCQYQCHSCGRFFCEQCMKSSIAVIARESSRNTWEDGGQINFCKFCVQATGRGEPAAEHEDEKTDIFVSPHQDRESIPFINFSNENQNNNSCSSSNSKPVESDGLAAHFLEVQQGYSPPAETSSCVTDHLSPVSFCWTASRSDEEDAEDTEILFLSPSIEHYQNISDVDSNSTNTLRHDFYNFKSVASSPLDSPSFSSLTDSPNRADYSLQHEQGGSPLRSQSDALLDQDSVGVSTRPEDLENSVDFIGNLSIFQNQSEKLQKPLDFENYGHIWLPPPPDDDEYDEENNFFAYDDDDDDVGDSGVVFSSSCFGYDASFATKEKPNDAHEEPLRAAVHGHFRALVSQLLKGEGVCAGNENGEEGWLEIVDLLAWQAANFVRPDTSRGGSMDPGDYVKVKCILSGSPSESTLIKGVVCTKNIKHKRMTSQYRNPRLLLLGGALEYQKVPNQLASMDTLLQQEIDHLKMAVAKIEFHRPNVLLVERSVSSYAQEYLRAKEISLVLNVKRKLLERIARCTGAHIVSSVDNLASARLGHCEIFRLEKVSEGCGFVDQPNKKSSKTLMFFENCPRRLGCTVLLRGTCREELKKVKHVIQYAVFAAYHLSLETSFLADEGASLPKMELKPPVAMPERLMNADSAISVISNATVPTPCEVIENEPLRVGACNKPGTACPLPYSDISAPKDSVNAMFGLNNASAPLLFPASVDSGIGSYRTIVSNMDLLSCSVLQCEEFRDPLVLPAIVRTDPQHEPLENLDQGEEEILGNHMQSGEIHKWTKTGMVDENEPSNEYLSASDNHQSILVSLSSRCVLKGTVCERSQIFRIKFYGSFDKPLGRYLRDDLFDQTSCCRSCKEPAEAHVRCYTHQQGALTISVRCLPSLKLPGERDGKIWMWHRCLKCADKDGVPPATPRVVMSDAAWGLSFGKFLELSFSNHATANRVASCGHSLQRDCLRYYGFGSMVAFFRYSPIDIFSVHLPPSMLEFSGQFRQQWVRREAVEISNKMEFLYAEVFDVLHSIEQKITSSVYEPLKTSDYVKHIVELKELLRKERTDYDILLQPATVENQEQSHTEVDILELNRLRHCLLLDSHLWNRRIYLLDTSLKVKSSFSKVHPCVKDSATHPNLRDWRNESFCTDGRHDSCAPEKNDVNSLTLENTKNPLLSGQQKELHLQLVEPNSTGVVKMDLPVNRTEGYLGPEDLELTFGHRHKQDEIHEDGEIVPVEKTSMESLPSPTSSLSDKIDLAWTGTGQSTTAAQFLDMTQPDEQEAGLMGATHQMDKTHYRKVMSPVRVYSFDSASRLQDRIHRKFSPASLHMSSVKSFHVSGDFGNLVRDPMSNMLRPHSKTSTRVSQKLNFTFSDTPPLISSTSRMVSEGVRLLLPQADHNDMVIAVYDNDPTSIISYALSSKEYEDFIADKSDEHEGWNEKDSIKGDDLNKILGYRVANPNFSVWQSFNSLDVDDIQSRSYGSDDALLLRGNRFLDSKRSSHFRVSFSDEYSSAAGKVRFSVTCYFAKQFDFLRKQCCPSEMDFIRSLSRCRRWNAQGGKSNVYFAKSLDERLIIKQVTKTELDSFEKFAPDYFKYLTHSISSGSPTCLAKVVGIYQVIIKHLKGGKEVKMDLMVMENLFFRRSISRVYDLKGSLRSRYNPDTAGSNKVLLDMNLLETLRTNPIFLGTKAKRRLERAVWNDTAFLASVDVMDYSLLVGVDEEGKELVLGIIDFMRQYTWDKHLETWVKASGILGGPKNASPTVISPKQYKKRFRKAMSSYFLTVPDDWSSS